MIRRPPRSTLFPYNDALPICESGRLSVRRSAICGDGSKNPRKRLPHSSRKSRSEEHTSELQSQSNLVCRLLLEKKNTSATHHMPSNLDEARTLRPAYPVAHTS